MPSFDQIQQALENCMKSEPPQDARLSKDSSKLADVFAMMSYFHKQEIAVGSMTEKQLAAFEKWKSPEACVPRGLPDCYALWDRLSAVAVSDGADGLGPDMIAEPFLHFAIGTPRENIWRWFEAQHPDFVVGELMQGIRR